MYQNSARNVLFNSDGTMVDSIGDEMEEEESELFNEKKSTSRSMAIAAEPPVVTTSG
jgi:hypothetical protein